MPYMTIAVDVFPDWTKRVPATTHINDTAKVQTVNKSVDTKYHSLIEEFYNLTEVPVILNTSFNIQRQPVVETPLYALSTFSSNGLDYLFIENYKFKKK